jgi:hypothetical protein
MKWTPESLRIRLRRDGYDIVGGAKWGAICDYHNAEVDAAEQQAWRDCDNCRLNADELAEERDTYRTALDQILDVAEELGDSISASWISKTILAAVNKYDEDRN